LVGRGRRRRPHHDRKLLSFRGDAAAVRGRRADRSQEVAVEPLSDLDALTRMGIAMGIGALLGLEREVIRKPAGVRTLMLVCQGACLFMLCSVLLAQQVTAAGGLADPTRIASTVLRWIQRALPFGRKSQTLDEPDPDERDDDEE
jgi:hypothetical protein